MARVLALLGEGGIAKSTLLLAMAQAEARRGKRVLLVSLEAVSTAALILDRPLSGEPEEVEPNLKAVHFRTSARMEHNWGRLRSAEEEFSRIQLFREVYGQELGVLAGLDLYLAMAALRDWDLSGNYDYLCLDVSSPLELLRMLAIPEQLGWYVRRFGDAFNNSPVGQILAPFLEPITRSLLTVNFSSDSVRQTTGRFSEVLNEGRSVMQDPQRLMLYLTAGAEPLSATLALRLWGQSQLLGLPVGGLLVRGERDWSSEFAPLAIRSIPTVDADRLPEHLSGLAGAAPKLPEPLAIDERARTVRLFLPGLSKKQVDLSQYGPELTVRAVDHRRNFALPPSFKGLRATGAKFTEGYLTISFG